MVFQWFPMVANHWSDDGMVVIHRSGLNPIHSSSQTVWVRPICSMGPHDVHRTTMLRRNSDVTSSHSVSILHFPKSQQFIPTKQRWYTFVYFHLIIFERRKSTGGEFFFQHFAILHLPLHLCVYLEYYQFFIKNTIITIRAKFSRKKLCARYARQV